MAGAVIVSVFACVLGAPVRAGALAAALALAPALATLFLAPRWGENWARAIALDSWSAAAAGAVALTGGTASPVSAVFVLGPVLALRLSGPARAAEATALAVISFAAAAAVAASAPALGVIPAPGAFTVLTLALAGWLIAAPVTAPAAAAAAPSGEAMTRRFAVAAHELRTPLGHIIGFAEIMQRQMFGPLPPKYAEYVDLIAASGRRMHGLASDWLDVGRLAAGRYEIHREAINLAAIVREAGQAARFGASAKQQSVTIVGADNRVDFNADPRALRQILDNLLTNAVKFAPAGGAITLRLIAGPNAAIVDVADNGQGIAPADKARLGRAFERGVNAGVAEGAGLGLMIAGALANAHGGRLDMLDAEGGGALMRVVLPQAPG